MDEKDGSTPINKATYAEEQEIKRVTDDYGRGKSPIQEYEDIYSTPEYQKDLIERHDQKLQEPVENPAQEPKDVQPVQEEAQPVAEQEPAQEQETEVQDQTEDETSDDVEETVTGETDQNKEVEDGPAEEPGKEGPEQEQEPEEAPQEPDPEDQMRRAREEARRRYSEELRNMRMQDAVALGIGAIGTGIASIGDSIGAVEHLFDAIMSGNPVSVASTMLADTLANNTRRENHINALFADYRVLRGADEAVLATTVRGNMLLSRKREVMRGDALATIEVGDWLKNRKGPDGGPLDVANMSAQDIADFNAFCRQRVTAITNMIHDPKAKLSPQDRRAWEATLRRYGWIISDVGARAGELRSQAEADVESATQAYDDAKEATSLAGDALHAAQAQHKASATGATASGAATGRKGKGPRTVNTSTTTTVVPPAQAGGTGPAPAPATTAVDPNQAVSDPDQDVDPNQAGNVTPPEETSADAEEAVDPQAQQVVDPDPQENVQEPPQPVPPPAYTDVVWSMESKWGANRGDYGVAYADQARTNRKNFASRIKTLEGNLARTAPGTPENIYLTNEIALRRGFNNMLILGNKFKGSPIYKVLSDVERKRVLDNLERSFSDFSKTMFDGNGYLRADAIMPDWIDPLNDIQYLSGKEAPNMFIEINNLRNSPVASDPNQSENMDELSLLSNDILDNPSKYSTPEGQAEFRTKFDAIKGRFTVASPTTPETDEAGEANEANESETETEEAPIDDYVKGLLTSDPDNFLNRVHQDATTGNDAAARTLRYLNDAGIADFDESTQTWQFLNGAGVDDLKRAFGAAGPAEEKEQDSEQSVENDAIEEPATEKDPGSEVNFSSFTTPEQFEDYLKENGDKGKDAINDWLFSIPEDQRPSFIESVLNTDYGNGDGGSEGEGQSAIKEALDQYYEENSKDDYEPFDVYKMFPDHTDVLNNIFNAYSENQLEGLLFPPGEDVELGELEDTLKDYHILAERDYVENGKERKGLYIHPEWKKGRQLLRAGERPDIHIPDVEEFKEKTRRVSPIGVSRYIQDLLRSKDYLDPEQTEKLEFLFSALEDRGIVPKGTFDDPELFKNVDKGAYNGLFTDGEKPQEFSDQFVYDEDSTYDELKSASKQLSEASKMGKGEVEAAEDLIDPALNALISTRTQTSKGKPISGMYGAFQLARALSVLHNSNNMEPEFRIEGGHYKELSEYDRNSVEKLLRAMRVRVERAKEAVKAENDGQFPPDALAQIRDRVKQEIVGKDPKKYHELFINPDREADLTDAKTVRDIGLTGPFNLGGKTMGISALRNIIDADKPDKPYEGDRDALDRARIHAANALLEGVGRSVITDPYFTGLRLLDGLEGGRWENHPVVTDLRKKLNDTMDSQEPQSLRDIKENFMGHDTDLINMISRVDRKSGNNPRFELKIMPDGDPYIWDNVLGSRILDRNRKFYRDPMSLGIMLDYVMDEDFASQQLKAYYMNNPELFHNLNAALDALYDDDEVRSLLGDMSDVDENEMLGYMFVAEADSPSPSVQLVLDEAIHNYLDGGMPWDVLKGYSAEDLVELAKNGMMAIDEARRQVGGSMRKSVSLFARAMIEEPDHEVTRFVLGMMGASPMENIEMFMKSVKPSEIGDPVFARITGTYRSLLGL